MKILFFSYFLSSALGDYLITGGANDFISDYTVLKNDGSFRREKRLGLNKIGGGYYQWHCSVNFRGKPYLIGGGNLFKHRDVVLSYHNETW